MKEQDRRFTLTLYTYYLYMHVFACVFIICICVYLKRWRYISSFEQFGAKKTLLRLLP